MQSAIRITTKVLSGNKVEIELPPGSVGADVEVIVILPELPDAPSRSAIDIINEAHSRQQLFRTPEEVDRYIREERDSWER
jgi:hypothetical protein